VGPAAVLPPVPRLSANFASMGYAEWRKAHGM
jgi:hypothetical protein